MNYFKREVSQFTSLSDSCRKLVVSNFIYSFVFIVLPFIANFFIFREFKDSQPEQVIPYQSIYFVGYYFSIPIGFLLNGFLLTRFKVNKLYIIGMMAEVFVIIPLFFLHLQTKPALFSIGMIMGVSSGLFWSNRHYMSIFVTENNNRNYVYGIENTLMNLAGLLSPLIFSFLTGDAKSFSIQKYYPEFPEVIGHYILAAFLILCITIASFNILNGKYHNPGMKRFFFIRYCSVWNKQRLMNILEGLTYGPLIVMPSFIFLIVLKDSSKLGLFQSLGTLAALIPLYLFARYSKPKHRILILLSAGAILLFGAINLAIYFNSFGAMTFMICSNIAFMLLYMPYLSIRMRAVNLSVPIDKRDEYAYLCDVEATLAIGRLSGLGIFMLIFTYGSQLLSLRYGFLIISLFPFIGAAIASRIKQEG